MGDCGDPNSGGSSPLGLLENVDDTLVKGVCQLVTDLDDALQRFLADNHPPDQTECPSSGDDSLEILYDLDKRLESALHFLSTTMKEDPTISIPSAFFDSIEGRDASGASDNTSLGILYDLDSILERAQCLLSLEDKQEDPTVSIPSGFFEGGGHADAAGDSSVEILYDLDDALKTAERLLLKQQAPEDPTVSIPSGFFEEDPTVSIPSGFFEGGSDAEAADDSSLGILYDLDRVLGTAECFLLKAEQQRSRIPVQYEIEVEKDPRRGIPLSAEEFPDELQGGYVTPEHSVSPVPFGPHPHEFMGTHPSKRLIGWCPVSPEKSPLEWGLGARFGRSGFKLLEPKPKTWPSKIPVQTHFTIEQDPARGTPLKEGGCPEEPPRSPDVVDISTMSTYRRVCPEPGSRLPTPTHFEIKKPMDRGIPWYITYSPQEESASPVSTSTEPPRVERIYYDDSLSSIETPSPPPKKESTAEPETSYRSPWELFSILNEDIPETPPRRKTVRFSEDVQIKYITPRKKSLSPELPYERSSCPNFDIYCSPEPCTSDETQALLRQAQAQAGIYSTPQTSTCPPINRCPSPQSPTSTQLPCPTNYQSSSSSGFEIYCSPQPSTSAESQALLRQAQAPGGAYSTPQTSICPHSQPSTYPTTELNMTSSTISFTTIETSPDATVQRTVTVSEEKPMSDSERMSRYGTMLRPPRTASTYKPPPPPELPPVKKPKRPSPIFIHGPFLPDKYCTDRPLPRTAAGRFATVTGPLDMNFSPRVTSTPRTPSFGPPRPRPSQQPRSASAPGSRGGSTQCPRESSQARASSQSRPSTQTRPPTQTRPSSQSRRGTSQARPCPQRGRPQTGQVRQQASTSRRQQYSTREGTPPDPIRAGERSPEANELESVMLDLSARLERLEFDLFSPIRNRPRHPDGGSC